MHFSTLLSSLALMSTTGWAQYVLEDDYLADGNFFDLFSFWDTTDPTEGFVAYQNQSQATDAKLISSSTTNIQMKVDSSNVTPNGRPSVRITSNKSYDSGLVIVDIDHMPGGICGTWPAFWLVGPDWPDQGEIDIIEGVNEQTTNDMTLHTGEGCSVTNNGAFSGELMTTDCWIDDPDQAANAGCQISASNTDTFGTGFNSNNGGVYATEWTDSAISVFFFPRGSIPSDITNGSPEPSSWGTPVAQFQGGCDIANNFTNQQIVFDTTFCGSWAGDVWASGSCASKADTCDAYVENNYEAFADAYWSVNALQVYKASSAWSDVAVSSAVGSSSSSMSVAAPSSVAAVSIAATSTSSVSPTTFAFTTKSVTILSTGVPPALNASSTYHAGNETNGPYPTGFGTGTAPFVMSTGIIGSGSVTSSPTSFTVSAASAPSSPPETTPSTTLLSTTASGTATGAHSYGRTWSRHGHGHEPTAAAGKRHLRQHKRHGAGLL
ncbi:hypothetical protein LTR36_003068 [Oleoguttula mirabilis]|uniref:endo-1,3(4)-beta-glucanase n=1 Tax=Oleoguttula mirabilis TaxID=1507867 RepID=A0AAV9JY67_9PEZI|nr:hypothetical protein LTR36_003068 [Oleoguttula mirabilis]